MKALVTGATGLIGRHLVDYLLRRGIAVRALVQAGTRLPWPDGADIDIVEGDVRDYPTVLEAVSGMETVYHLAALTKPDADNADALKAVNVGGTENVALACLEHDVRRLVHASSVAIHGRRIRRHGINEDTAAKPDSPYSQTKFEAERLLLSYRERRRLPVVIVRTTNVFGVGAEEWREMFQIIALSRLRLIGQGGGLMQLTSTGDITEGLWLCGTISGIEGRIYTITSGQSVSLRQWLDLICAEVGGTLRTPSIPALPLRLYNFCNSAFYATTGRELPKADRINLFLGDRSFDIGRARRELGFDPKSSPAEIARTTADWYRAMGWLDGAES